MRALLVTVLLLCCAQAWAGPRWAVVVGHNEGQRGEVELRYAETDAAKMEKALVDLGQYENDDVYLLTGVSAADVRGALDAMLGRSRQQQAESVMFYFSGHGDGASLHLGESELTMEEVRDFLDEVNAEVKIAIIDACKSGAMVRAKGLTVGPPFAVDAIRDPKVEGSVIITSSTGDEISQESDELFGSFFTHYWVSGLYGAADKNDDGHVTLAEAYQYAHYQTVSRTIESQGGVQHPTFAMDLTGEGSVVLADLGRRTAQIVLRADGAAGDYLILDAERELVLQEAIESHGGEVRVPLPPGRYRIKKREKERVLTAEIDVGQGDATVLRDKDMKVSSIQGGDAKGGLTPLSLFSALTRAVGVEDHGPEVWLGARSFLVQGLSPGPELTAGYRVRWKYAFVQPRAAVRLATYQAGGAYMQSELDLGAAVGGNIDAGPLLLGGGLDGGVVAFHQQGLPTFGPPAGVLPVTAQGRLFGEVGTDLFDTVHVGARTYGGVSVYGINGLILPFPLVGAQLGVSYRF